VRAGGLTVRAMFITYLLLIVVGLGFAIAIGLIHS
jgi:hypothetical protein